MRNMWVATVEDYRPTPPVTRFREGAVVGPPGLCSRAMREMNRSATWLREQAAQAIDKTLGVSNGELLLESMLWPSEVAQEAHNSASTFKTTGDVAGALRHAPAYSITFTDVTTLAHMPATHNTQIPIEKQVSATNPARRIVVARTAPVTTPATEECHRKPVKNCRQGGPLWRGQQERSS